MKEELIRLMKEGTYLDVKTFSQKVSTAPRKTYAAALSVKSLISGKPNQFLQYVQLELDKKEKKQLADFIQISGDPFKLQIAYKGSNQMSIGNLLKDKLNYFNELPTNEFHEYRIEDDTPVIDCVAYAMLKHTYIPTVLSKVLAIFDILPPDDTIEIQTWEPNEGAAIVHT